MLTLLRHQCPAVAYIWTHSVNLAFGPKSGFKSVCRARAVFGFQNEARLQLCFTTKLTSQMNLVDASF